ncbi:MAG: Spy/CpxP family protein refolding chaperone [Pseudomonadota bacterium]
MAAVYFLSGLVTGLAAAAGVIFLFYLKGKGRRASGKKIQGYLDLIPGLTDLQKQKVQEIRRVFLPRVDGIRRSMKANRARLAELLFAEPPDRDSIYRVVGEITGSQAELEREVIEHILEEKELLSPEQNKRFREIIMAQFSSGGLGVHDVKTKT